MLCTVRHLDDRDPIRLLAALARPVVVATSAAPHYKRRNGYRQAADDECTSHTTELIERMKLGSGDGKWPDVGVDRTSARMTGQATAQKGSGTCSCDPM